MLTLIRPGSTVRLKGGVNADVLAVWLRGPKLNVEYQVSWWDGNSLKSDWVPEFQVEKQVAGGQTQIGFGSNED